MQIPVQRYCQWDFPERREEARSGRTKWSSLCGEINGKKDPECWFLNHTFSLKSHPIKKTYRENQLILQLGCRGRWFLIVRHENSGLDLKNKLDHFPFITVVELRKQTAQDPTTQFELLSEWSPVPVLTAALAPQQKQQYKDLMGGIQGNSGVNGPFTIVLQWNWNIISYFSKVYHKSSCPVRSAFYIFLHLSLHFPNKIPPKLHGSFDR